MATAEPNNHRKEDHEPKGICRYYLTGTCKYGNNCKFSHDLSLPPSQVCYYYKRGKCKFGNACRFLHINNATSRDKTSKERACNSKKIVSDGINWCEAVEFIPGKKYTPRFTEDYYSSALKDEVSHDDNFCPLSIEGQCLNGDDCYMLHGILCEICNLYLLHPANKLQQEKHKAECLKYFEEDMKDSFKIAKSNTLVCGICMEKVSEKTKTSERRFGLLENCNHIFCLDCIRTWRSADNFQKKVVKSCPECRVASSFVTPSSVWIEDEEEKKKLISSYKNSLSKKSCKYFDQGRGKCPFGRYCFYLHAFPDGTKQDKTKLKPKRAVANKEGDSQDHSTLLQHWLDYDEFNYTMLNEFISGDEDDFFDFLLLDSSLDSDPEFDFMGFESGNTDYSDFEDVY